MGLMAAQQHFDEYKISTMHCGGNSFAIVHKVHLTCLFVYVVVTVKARNSSVVGNILDQRSEYKSCVAIQGGHWRSKLRLVLIYFTRMGDDRSMTNKLNVRRLFVRGWNVSLKRRSGDTSN